MPGRDKQTFWNLLGLAFVFVVAWASVASRAAPAIEDAPRAYDLPRALDHVREIAQRPHPIGSEDNRRVRNYIAGEMRELGLGTEIQSTTELSCYYGALIVARSHNVIATLSGRGDDSLLLMAHYDTQPQTPGAADDTSGVVTLMETARILNHEHRGQNNVVFLFTDGEEAGLIGARAFAASEAEKRGVKVVLNFEGRGNQGPVLMFQTGPDNLEWMRFFAKHVPNPVATSIYAAVYRILPNDTDFSPFLQNGLPGYNFAFVRSPVHYHAPTDTADRLNRKSLVHHAAYSIPLTRSLARQNLNDLKGDSNATYFDLFSRWLVVYDARWNIALLIVCISLILFRFLTVDNAPSSVVWKKHAKALLVFPGALFATMASVQAFQFAILLIYPELGNFRYNAIPQLDVFAIGATGLGVAVYLTVEGFLRKRLKTGKVDSQASLWMLLFSIVAVMTIIDGSFVLLIPLLFALTSRIILERFTKSYSVAMLLAISCVSVTVYIFAPIIDSGWQLFGTWLPAACGLFIAISMALLGVHGILDREEGRTILRRVGYAIAATCFIAIGVTREYTQRQPLHVHLNYFHDWNENRAYWLTERPPETDSWLGPLFSDDVPVPGRAPVLSFFTTIERAASAIPDESARPPALRVIEEERRSNGERTLTLEVQNQNDGLILDLDLPHSAIVTEVDGRPAPACPIGERTGLHVVRMLGDPERPYRIKLTMDAQPGDWALIERAPGVPLPRGFTPMPANRVPASAGVGSHPHYSYHRMDYRF